jgi:hypothetical protein
MELNGMIIINNTYVKATNEGYYEENTKATFHFFLLRFEVDPTLLGCIQNIPD